MITGEWILRPNWCSKRSTNSVILLSSRASNLQKKKDDADNDEVYYLNHKIKTKTKTIAKLKSQLEEFIHNTAYWRNCIAQTNADIEVLQVG